MPSSTLIFIPTYNERDNVENMLKELLALDLGADIVFLDDNSPDGTGRLLDELALRTPQLSVIHRTGKLGIGSAHQEGIAYAYDKGYSILITMDCDFTHSPQDIPRLLAAARDADISLGSRYMQEDSLPGWNLFRRTLTRFGHLLTETLLQMPYDATGAFRIYKLENIPRNIFGLIQARGYAFFFESLFILSFNKLRVAEVPIVLPARTYGTSKMSWREAFKSGLQVWKLFAAKISNPGRFRPSTTIAINPALGDPQNWDVYWTQKSRASNVLYDIVATIYRRNVIERQLTTAIRRYFPDNSRLLHAGCGSGEVDRQIQETMRITAVDISPAALQRYGQNNPKADEVRHASIFSLPFADGTFDGVYNLGVVEHFSEDQIREIIVEFRRVLKPGGRCVIFWPHRYASSVTVLRVLHWLLNEVFHKAVEFHPAEISLLKSRSQAYRFLQEGGLKPIGFTFGASDGFVQAIVVGEREHE